MRRDGGSVFPAHANTGDPNGPLRGLSANDVARALISMMVRSENELQSETGYIDARPHHPRSTKSSCTARPDHTFGSISAIRRCVLNVRDTLDSGHGAGVPQCPSRATTGLMQCSKQIVYSIT